MEISNPPIEKAFVHYNNDPSVGMFPFGFEITLHITGRDKEELDEIREKIGDLYELIEGEKPTWIKFDFELENELAAESLMDQREKELENCTDDY